MKRTKDIKIKLYVTKIFDNDLVTKRKSKVALKLKIPAYVRMYILDLSQVLMYEFHHDNIKTKYVNNSRLLFTNTDSLVHEIKKEDVCEDFSKDKGMCDFSNYSVKPKYYDSNKYLLVR